MGKEVVVDKLPPCDFCKQEGIEEPAEYDGKTIFGPWVNMCEEHFNKYGVGGTGKGQRLKRPIKPDCEHDWCNLRWNLDEKVVKCRICGEEMTVELDSEIGGRLPFI